MASPRVRFVSIGTKVTLPAILALSLVALVVYLELGRGQRDSQLGAKETAATMVARLFSAGVATPLTFGDEKGVQEQVALLTTNDQVLYGAVWAVDADEASRLGSRLGEVTTKGFAAPSVPAVVRGVEVRRSADFLVVDAPVVDPTGKPVGVAEVVFSLARENAAIRATSNRTLFASLCTALGLVVVLFALTRMIIVRPLARLAAAAKRLESGEAVEIDVRSGHSDEIGQLASGFAAMSRAIAAREQRISERNRDLRRVLDNVAEGFLTVDLGGTMSAERSGILETWFGPVGEALSFHEYIGRVAPKAGVSARLGWSALQEDFLPVELVIDQLPQRFDRNGRYFALEYRPIVDGEALVEVLVVIRDISQQVERERAELGQREMAAMFRRILGDRAGFDGFLAEASVLVASLQATTTTDAVMLRLLHTLKGNMAVFGVESITSFCHAVEERIGEDGEPMTAEEHAGLATLWAALVETSKRLGAGSSAASIELDVQEHEALLAALREGVDRHAIAATVASFRNERASARLSRLADQLEVLAQRLGKGEIEVRVASSPSNLRLASTPWAELWPVFAHVIRNTVDHGIEAPAERMAHGKTSPPRVTLALDANDGGATLTISDDGAGVDWDAIRARAESLGLPHATAAELEEALYTDRVSAREHATEVSGRGVGMGAVREAVRAAGGRMELSSRKGEGTTLRFVFPRAAHDESGTRLLTSRGEAA